MTTSEPPSSSGPRTKRTAIPRFLTSVPVDADLTWFINHAESAMGVRSTHGALVAMIETGGVSRGAGVRAVGYTNGICDVEVHQAAGERRLLSKHHRSDADRDRRLRARFLALTSEQRAVLCEAYAVRNVPHEMCAPLGALAGVALLTSVAINGYPAHEGRPAFRGHPEEMGRGEWLRALCRKPGQNAEPLEAMRKEAAAKVFDALMAWRETR